MATPKEHIEEIRKTYMVGSDQGISNRVLKQFHQAVKLLSAELYAKDVHFLMELIQNAEDNEYPEGVDPSLEFVITCRDITCTGAPATLLIFNNERGFSAENIESICSVAMSTKKGNRKRGYVGEKGIGFKSVFLITSQPYIFSNGYQIRFSEEPWPHCDFGYIVPEWVEENPSLSDIQKIYGSSSTLPATTFVLPLKQDKVKPVKKQLLSVHPELLLFLSKIKRLSFREDNEDPGLKASSAITINSETDGVTRKSIDAESYTIRLSANGEEFDEECMCFYYMWRQKFPVKQENRVERRMEIDEWVITLAFPYGQRVQRGTNPPGPGIYAFLPTDMVTNFPFIIQADFLLPSSREKILLDDKWNLGILNCVPSAFVSALISLVQLRDQDTPVSTLTRMFRFLPVNSSSYQELNAVRESIRTLLVEEDIVLSESCTKQKFFYKPCEVGRLMPRFWKILEKAKDLGASLKNLSRHGIKVLNSSFDREEYDRELKFLGVETVNNEWYAKYIQSSDLVWAVSEDVYSEILLFVAENWTSKFCNTNIGNIPLIKYVDRNGKVALCCIDATAQYCQRVVCLSLLAHQQSWLIDWNREFRCVANCFFMPESTYDAIRSCSKKEVVLQWLRDRVKVVTIKTYDYAKLLIDHLNNDRNLAVVYAHFLYHSFSRDYLSLREVDHLCRLMPLVDNDGAVNTTRDGVLVPAKGSKWAELTDSSNPWRQEGYIELGEDYLRPGNFAGQSTREKQFMDFLMGQVAASDIPDISPPDAGISDFSNQLTKENAFLLLDWIKNLKYKGNRIPEQFLTCVRTGSWLAVNGCSSSNRPPSQSFFLTSSLGNNSLGNVVLKGSVLVDIPLVNASFYGECINEYTEELKTVGVMFEYREACKFIGKRLMSLASSSDVTRDNVFSILNFIKFLREQYLSPDSFIQSVKEGSWLKTSHGYRSPVTSILYDQEWEVASQISDIPFIDQNEYGEEILCFKVELQLLGVTVGFNQNYQLVVDCLKFPSTTSLSAEAVLLVLACVHHSSSSYELVKLLRDAKWLKTNAGYKSPGECFLSDPEWGCLLKVFDGLPMIDQNFYGSDILSWKRELKHLGVEVDFEKAVKKFVCLFKKHASFSSISKEHVISFLSSYRQLKGSHKFPPELKKCFREEKWLRTQLGDYRSPEDCILFGPDWEFISPITVLPFIDDSDRFYGQAIYEYEKELKSMGVVVELKDGLKFVAAGLCIPQDPCNVTGANLLSFLKCIRLLKESSYTLPDSFDKKVSREWLKTYGSAGFSSPNHCFLFDSKWKKYLKQTDGPFIDEEFYGSEIKSYRKELNAIGVIVDIEKGCPLLASQLGFHTDFPTIVRIYNFLAAFNWKADSEAPRMIWIPDGSEEGQWVSPGECVLHDKDGLFSSELNILEKHYEKELLSFFKVAFSVKPSPSMDDYCKLWKVWESSGQKLSNAECCAFWGFVVKHWNSMTEKILTDNLVKLPVNSGTDGISLFNKWDVFIADDLQLKHLFTKSSPQAIFVWYPQPSLPALPRTKLLELYTKIGVRTISESVQKEELSLGEGLEHRHVNQKDFYIGNGLVKLILGFLASPSIQFEAAKRHEAVKSLLNLTILETAEPIRVRYSLKLSTGEFVEVRATQTMRWDRESGKLFTKKKIDRSGGNKKLIEYATDLSEIISRGILWERDNHTNALAELIKLAFVLEFDEEAVEYLMESKNLQIFKKDEEFLSAAFPSE